MTDDAVLNVIYNILAEDDTNYIDPLNGSTGVRSRRSSFHILFGDELLEAVGDDCKYIC